MKSRQKNWRESRSRKTEVGEKIAVTSVYCVALQMLRAQNQLQKAINYDRLFCQFREHLLNACCVQITSTSNGFNMNVRAILDHQSIRLD